MARMLRIQWKPTGNEAYDRLLGQFVERVARYARGGSIQTRVRKYERYRAFLRFLAAQFGPQDIRNIQPRHVAAYIAHRRRAGVQEKTILAELSIIRWWHNQIPWRKYEMPDNKTLFELEERLDDKTFSEEVRYRYKITHTRRKRLISKSGGPVRESLPAGR
ncbi:phage integrase N-terminal domain-containing protein [Neomoorella thermoacetica]|uniref:phage integrase N-terminal domain-containing protein n=2 Tax=Neomoorella thermoacetica TaxID=1525 RepID=UPI0003235503|nr:phage integrase N-terminal domain-containing protein [Moorella thermoacetica]